MPFKMTASLPKVWFSCWHLWGSPFSVMDRRHMRRRLSIGDTCREESQGEVKCHNSHPSLHFLSLEAHPSSQLHSQHPRLPAHLPVDVLFNVARALPDVEALQQRCEESEESQLLGSSLATAICADGHLSPHLSLHPWGGVKGPQDF